MSSKKSEKGAVYRSVDEFKEKFFPTTYNEEMCDESPADRAMGASDAGASQAKESLKSLQVQSGITRAKEKSR